MLFPADQDTPPSPVKKGQQSETEIPANRIHDQYKSLIEDINKEVSEVQQNGFCSLSELIEDVIMTRKGEQLLNKK